MCRKKNILLLFLLWSLTQSGWSADLRALQQEARLYAGSFTSADSTKRGPEQAGQLMRAADILTGLEDCDTAFKTRKHALSLGHEPTYSVWMALTKDAACSHEWSEAALAAQLAVSSADTPMDKARALARMGSSLEKRSKLSEDWQPAAISAFQQVLEIVSVDWVKQRIDELTEAVRSRNALHIDRIYSLTDTSMPGFCVDFSDWMPAVESFHYQDYIQIEPAIPAVFSLVRGDEICIHGADFGTEYQVLVRKGLSAEDKVLGRDKSLSIEVGHRPASFWFKRSAYVLPATQDSAVPLYSINAERVNLQLMRIHERNMLSPLVQRNFQSGLNGRDLEQIRDTLGEVIWQGEMKLDTPMDIAGHTVLQLPRSQIDEPGLYVLVAQQPKETDRDYYYGDLATQWLVVTDIGLTSYQGTDGLLVMARSLASGLPLANVEVALYARNNQSLSHVRTDEQGLARFAPGLLRGTGGRTATQLTATGVGSGLSMLSLQRAALDLSDRGVSGRRAPGPLDAFVYTERGVYRPGETLNAVALLRDQLGSAVNGLPLTVRLLNPQGNPVAQQVIKPNETGGYLLTLPLSSDARTGRWQLNWFADTDASAVGQTGFLVEAIRPPRMQAKLSIDGVLVPGEPLQAELSADYLFGAPAANRPVHTSLRLEADPEPFPEYPGYHFLPQNTDETISQQMIPEVSTDRQGKAHIRVELDESPQPAYPLRARMTAQVSDVDGRVVVADASMPVRHLPFYIGIAPQFSDNRSQINAAAAFKVLALDAAGNLKQVEELSWRLVEIERDYQWFSIDGEWGYELIHTDRVRQQGSLRFATGRPVSLTTRVAYGNYRLEVYDQQQGLMSSVSFQAGEQVASKADTPDAVNLTLDQQSYRAGEPVTLEVQSPFAGKASLVLATDKIQQVRQFDLATGKATLDIQTDGSWGAGAYALVTVYRPGGSDAGRIGRAVGLVWIDIDPLDKRLAVTIDTPDEVKPRQTIEVPIRVVGHSPGERVNLTLAAVDEGVLQLTEFKTPDPLQYYFGKRRLATQLRDLYGQIIQLPGGKPGSLRTGAGSAGRRGAPLTNIQIVSEFSGLVTVDEAGLSKIQLSLPDFNGRLRLMAVVWSNGKLGMATNELLVRDPLVVSPSLPRFLTVDDRSEMSVLLQNISAPEGEYVLSATAESGLSLPGQSTAKLNLQQGQSAHLSLPVVADYPGTGKLSLKLTGPAGYTYQKVLTLGTRGPALPVLQRSYSKLSAGAKLTLDQQLLAGFYPESVAVTSQFSSDPGLDVPGLLKALDIYPYGCLEQLTSRALPLLYYNELARRWDLTEDAQLSLRVETAIRRILEKQHSEGGFGLWSERDVVAPWVSLYALEFLLKARETGFKVPDYFIDRGLDWIRRGILSNNTDKPLILATQAYGHYVLALAGRAKPEELRYLFDTQSTNLPTAMAAAQLGAALAMYGQVEQAKTAFSLALSKQDRQIKWRDYGSRIRDLAAVINLLLEAGAEYGDASPLIKDLVYQQGKRRWLSTQEQAWMVLAARALEKGRPMNFSIDGQKQSTSALSHALQLNAVELQSTTTIENLGNQPLWVTTTIEGAPNELPNDPDNQFQLQREIYHLSGQQADLQSLTPGEVLVTVIRGQAMSGDSHPALVIDLLPAGMEVENPDLANGMRIDALSWLPELSETVYVDLLDDRFVAALNIAEKQGDEAQEFTLAYMVRVVVPGTYLWPPAEVEDMYRPFYRARSNAASLGIKPDL